MSFYGSLKTNSGGSKVPLPVGKYQDLEIVYDLGAKETKDKGLFRHSLLVASESEEGTAFLSIQRKEQWSHPAVVALAFTTDKQDVIGEAVKSGEVTQQQADEANQWLASEAMAKVEAANTPDDAKDEAFKKALENLKTQIRIALGQLFRLQDWKNGDETGAHRDPAGDISALVGTKFAGTVKEGLNGSVEIGGIASYKKPAATAAKPAF